MSGVVEGITEIKTVICSRCKETVEGQEGRNYLICENSNNQLFRRHEGILCVPCLGEGGGVEVSEGARKILKVRDKVVGEIEEDDGEEEASDSRQDEDEEGKLQGDETSEGVDHS